MEFCAEQGCRTLVASGRCAEHQRRRDARQYYPAPIAAWYSSAAWRRLRAEVRREQPFCRPCRLAGRKSLSTQVDHVVKHHGDRALFFDKANLQGICASCHLRKTARGE